MASWVAYCLVACTVLLTVCGQFLIKWQVLAAGRLPSSPVQKFWFVVHLLLNPWVIAAIFAAFLASLTWMLAMTRLQLSHAYPLTALTFVLVVIGSAIVFAEPLTTPKLIGLVLIVVGIVVGSQG